MSQVPPRSLLSRLTDHYMQIIANRAPIGFEAEFVGHRGFPMLYRGILMPFSSDGDAIDYLYGVINWKEVVDTATQSQLSAELAESRRAAPRRAMPAAAWADGPSAALAEPAAAPSLTERLVEARRQVEAARDADAASPTMRAALGNAYDFLLATEREPAGYAAMLVGAGLTVDPRAPVEALVRLVFGAGHDDDARLLARAHRAGVGEGSWATGSSGRPGDRPHRHRRLSCRWHRATMPMSCCWPGQSMPGRSKSWGGSMPNRRRSMRPDTSWSGNRYRKAS
ncbi:hypothetical protein ACVOMT_09770 [Sphingomonas panni]